MKKTLLVCCLTFLFACNLSLKAQTSEERMQFYKAYKNSISNKTAIINADSNLYQEALKNGWFEQVASGLKNAEDYAKGIIGNEGGSSRGSGTCSTATPFCTSSGSTYPAGVATGEGEIGPYYGCLGSTPNPAWFFLKIATGGNITITETNSANYDVDFALWGPFTSQNSCGSLTAEKYVDCSYSSSANEYIDIASAVAGEYYILLITNFSNSATNITLAKTGGTATTDCSITQVPQTPTATAATSILSTSFQANWSAASGDAYPATSFVLDVSTQSNFASFVSGFNNVNVGNVSTYAVTTLSSGTTYYYRVRGVNTTGQSPNSNTITAQTSSNPAPANPTSVSATYTELCNGSSTVLTANGAIGTVYWYTGSCGGTATSPSTGNTLTVTPSTTTTYYARNYNNSQFSEGCASITITVAAQPTAPSLTKNPNVASVCSGQSLTVSATSGTGGAGTISDQYSYSTNNGSSWSSWSISVPAFNAVIGTNLIRSRRTATVSGCNESSYNQVSWNVVAQPIAPGLTKVPTDAAVCVNQTLTVTATAGSGGTGTISDEYRFSTNNGSSWSSWSTSVPSFAAVSGTNLIQSRRTATGTGCSESTYNQVSWSVYQAFVAGAIATTGETICSGTSAGTTIGNTTSANGGNSSITYKWKANGNDIASSDAATYLPGALTQTTTFTRWAKDGTCNTEFTQSTGNWIVTVKPLLQYRSKQSGNWTTLANWEQYNGASWVAATSYPGQASNDCSSPLVSIRASHLMEIQSGSTIDIPNLEIKATGRLTVKSGGKIFVQDQLQLEDSSGGAIIVE